MDPDQENPIMLGEDGMIYFWRDNGAFNAYRDNGSSFDKVWVYQPVQTTGAALYGNMAIGPNGNIFIFDIDHLVRLDQHTGDILAIGQSRPLSQPSLTISSDSLVYVNDGKGSFLLLDYNLNQKEALAASGNVYCNPSLSREGVMVITQAGNKISAFKSAVRRSPVADFTVSRSSINVGESLDFLEVSSYQADSFEWIFEGADTRISFERNPVGIRYPVAGEYRVSLKVTNAYGSDSLGRECFITVRPFVLNKDIANPGFFVYPIPAHNILMIRRQEEYKTENYFIVNLKGQRIKEGSIGAGSTSLALDGLDPGIYVISLGGEYVRFIVD